MSYDSRPLREYMEHGFTYQAGFVRNVRRFGRSVAMMDPASRRRWTYRELSEEVERLASVLARCGVGRGDHFAFDLFNTPQFAICYLAAHRLGAVGTVLNCRLAPGELAQALLDARPTVFIYDAEIAGNALEGVGMARSQAPGVASHLFQVRPAGARPELPDGVEDFDEAVASAQPPAPGLPADFSSYEEVVRLYTSGTTGMPKGVPIASMVDVMSAHDVIMHFPLGPEDRTLNMTPWFHRGGLHSGGPCPVFYVGGSLVPMREFDADRVLDWVRHYNLTFLVGAPTTLEALAVAQEARPRDLSTLRGIVTMGAPLDAYAAERYMSLLTPRIFNGYGTTETFWNTFLRPSDLPRMAGSAGRPSTDDDVIVVRSLPDRMAEPDELAAKDNVEIGEVAMRSPKCGWAYSGENGAADPKFHSGWFYPGDLATWDEDGFVTIVGRKDEMLISGGENVFPAQVEAVLETCPGVSQAMVVGAPDPHWGQRVVAYVVADGVSAEELDAHCLASEKLARFKRPRGYRFVPEIPMTATGKKKHVDGARMAADDASRGRFIVPGRH